jgi:hypothetical protein
MAHMSVSVSQRILEKPLVPIRGKIGGGCDLAIYAHDGFAKSARFSDEFMDYLQEKLPYDQVTLVMGSRENPAFSWPHYALKRRI